MLTPVGHAIECRIYAEDPDNGFRPSPGRIQQLRAAAGPGIRDDSGATAGLDVPVFYDPMISKLMSWAEDRPIAIARMRRALEEYRIGGIKTTLPFFTWLLAQPAFLAGRFHTTYLDEVVAARAERPFVEPPAELEEVAAIGVALQALLSPAAARDVDLGARRWKAQARTESLQSGAMGTLRSMTAGSRRAED
jgi:acetyl-CoA carboxylase biotin carboxylase subunit